MRFIQHIILLVLVANSLMPMVDRALDGKVSELIGYDLSLFSEEECESDDRDNHKSTGEGLVNSNKQNLQEPKPNDIDSSPAKSSAQEPATLVVLPYEVKNTHLSKEAGIPNISTQLKKWTYFAKSSPLGAFS